MSPDDDLFDDPADDDELEDLDELDQLEALGEDHRGANPGYDLDEQEAIEELEAEQPDED
jgi:hypothetical protein